MSKTYEVSINTNSDKEFSDVMKEQLTNEISRISTMAQSELLAKMIGGSVLESEQDCECEDKDDCNCEDDDEDDDKDSD